MPYPLCDTATLRYLPAKLEADVKELIPDLDRHPVWCASLMLGQKCDKVELMSLLAEERIFLWRVVGLDDPSRLIGFLVHSRAMQDDELSLYFIGPRDEEIMVEALDHLAGEIFARNPKVDDVYAALPLPLAPGSEEALLSLGFIVCRASTDFGLKRSFYLERGIFDLNHEDEA